MLVYPGLFLIVLLIQHFDTPIVHEPYDVVYHRTLGRYARIVGFHGHQADGFLEFIRVFSQRLNVIEVECHCDPQGFTRLSLLVCAGRIARRRAVLALVSSGMWLLG